MRTLVTAVASAIALAALSTIAWAAAAPDATLRASRTGVTLATPDVRAIVHGSESAGFDKAEVGLSTDLVQAKLFRNSAVVGDFTGSGLHFGKAVRSPYLAGLGIGDGLSARLRSGPYSIAGAYVSGINGDSVAAELAAFRGAVALQAGYRETGRAVGSTSFAGAHVDFDVLNAQVSLRWHMGLEDTAVGTRETSAGSVAVGMQSVLEDGDRLRAAMSRPVRPEFGLESPDVALSYMMPMSLGRLTCSGAVEAMAQVSRVKVSWGLTW